MHQTPDELENAISLEQARSGLESVSRRIALLHLAYARAIEEELGEDRGRQIIARAIKDYGVKIGEKTREEVVGKGLEAVPENFGKGSFYALPPFPGMHTKKEKVEIDGKTSFRAYGCILADVWKEYGQERLGRLYCYMDTAKYMAYNPAFKYVHTRAIPDGDEFCEFEVKHTTEQEKRDFLSENTEWFYIDK